MIKNIIQYDYHPEKYLSNDAIAEYFASKKEDFGSDKIYVVEGHIYESGDSSDWIEELFTDEAQAKACCEFRNLTNRQRNVEYSVYEIDGLCNEDYVSKLKHLKETNG